MKRISLIVGHTQKNHGASNYLGQTEYHWNSMIAAKVTNYIRDKTSMAEVKIFFRDRIGRFGVAQVITNWKADLSLELHFNSFKTKAYGCEILTLKGDAESLRIADHLSDELSLMFSLKQRDGDGVRELIDGDLGYYNLKILESIPIAMLVEPCFANIKTAESAAIFEDPDKYAELLADELLWAVGLGEPDEDVDKCQNDLPEIPEQEHLLVAQVKELKEKNEMLNNILDDQHEAWLELSTELGKALDIISTSIDKMIEVSQKTWKENT